MKSYKDVLEEGSKYLLDRDIEEGKIDAWYLFSHIFSIDRARYFLINDKEVSEFQYNEYMDLIKIRANHVPLQHILGYTEFMGLKFNVNEYVLIPRQDTEVLVHEVMKVSEGKNVLDLCTGSGCIIVSLKKLGSINKAVASDISKEALKLAKENADINDASVTFIESDLFSNIEDKFDIIVSNPPYIPAGDIEKLSIEVKEHEPHLALDGKEDGLYFYRLIAKDVKNYIDKEGYLFIEIGYNQAEDLVSILESEGIKEVEVIKDLVGLDRVIKARIYANDYWKGGKKWLIN